jgi:hypothetical protein
VKQYGEAQFRCVCVWPLTLPLHRLTGHFGQCERTDAIVENASGAEHATRPPGLFSAIGVADARAVDEATVSTALFDDAVNRDRPRLLVESDKPTDAPPCLIERFPTTERIYDVARRDPFVLAHAG